MAAVLIHGRDQDEQVMLDVARRLALPDVAYLLPVAPGNTWYPGRYFDPLADNQPQVDWALETFEAALATVAAAGVPESQTVLAGFSQGACLVAELIARRPRPLAGAAVLTGTLLGPAGQRITPAPVDGLAMLFASSRQTTGSTSPTPRRPRARSRGRARDVTFEAYEDRVHHVSDAAVAALRAVVHRAGAWRAGYDPVSESREHEERDMPNPGHVRGTHHLTLCVGGARRTTTSTSACSVCAASRRPSCLTGRSRLPPVLRQLRREESTLLTSFPYRQVGWMGKRGTNQAKTINLSVPPNSIGFWADRLAAAGVEHERLERFGTERLSFSHPCGIEYALVGDPQPDAREPYDGPVSPSTASAAPTARRRPCARPTRWCSSSPRG